MDRLPHLVDRTLLCHCVMKLAARGLCGQAWRNRSLFATKVEGHDVGKCRQAVCHGSRDRERFPPASVCSEPVRVLPISDCQLPISSSVVLHWLWFLALHFNPLLLVTSRV